MQELERIQKRAMSIICPGVIYHEALVVMNFEELPTHYDEICESLFHTTENDNNSGELRNGSSLHAGFYDLILFFPVSSFILILDRCV